jgi:hypothetical protein
LEFSIQTSARSINLKQDFAPARLCKIQRDAKHVAAVLHPVGRYLEALFGVERDPAVAPCKIAKNRALNLDHLRAHFGAQRGGIGLRDQNSRGNNFETGKWTKPFRHQSFMVHVNRPASAGMWIIVIRAEDA